jgi:hypothetical protein
LASSLDAVEEGDAVRKELPPGIFFVLTNLVPGTTEQAIADYLCTLGFEVSEAYVSVDRSQRSALISIPKPDVAALMNGVLHGQTLSGQQLVVELPRFTR